MPDPIEIRPAALDEAEAILDLQLRASLIWEQYRENLTRSRDAIALTPGAIEQSRVRVAIVDGRLAGFCEWSVVSMGRWELEGLFVEPELMRKGIGSLLVEDLCDRARADGAGQIVVTAGPAVAFYERLGFEQLGPVRTRFGPAVRMRLPLVDKHPLVVWVVDLEWSAGDDWRAGVRSVLMEVLGAEVGVEPQRIEIERNQHGAPRLAGPPDSDVWFSVSHCRDLALIAVSQSGPVGIDLEAVDRPVNVAGLTERYFHPAEAARLAASAEGRDDDFFRYWTAKEAYVKALGLGLQKPLASFEVELSPDGDPALVSDRDNPIAGWALLSIELGPGWCATLAAKDAAAQTPRVRSYEPRR